MTGNIIEWWLRFVFPPRCVICRKVIEVESYYSICSSCFLELPFVKGRVCRFCGKSLLVSEMGDLCGECSHESKYYDQVLCPCEYMGSIKKAIRELKYYGKRKYASFLAMLIEEKIRVNGTDEKIDLITCVPIHAAKLKVRGYNQSGLIAGELGKRLGIPVNGQILRKTRETGSQSKLTRSERMENVLDSYGVMEEQAVKDKAILLTDDVITTGSTVNECSRELKKCGARKIVVAVAATGSRQLYESRIYNRRGN